MTVGRARRPGSSTWTVLIADISLLLVWRRRRLVAAMLRRPGSRAHGDGVPTRSGRGDHGRAARGNGALAFGAVSAPARPAGRIHYAWVVVGVTFLALLCA